MLQERPSRSTAASGATTRRRAVSRSWPTGSVIPGASTTTPRASSSSPPASSPISGTSCPGGSITASGQHFNPYVYSDIQTIADHRHRSAHGGARSIIGCVPDIAAGRIFMANLHEHAVLTDISNRKAPASSAPRRRFSAGQQRPVDRLQRRDRARGAVYVLDWHDGDICGMDVRQKETGRIFRIAPRHSRAEHWPGRYGDLAKAERCGTCRPAIQSKRLARAESADHYSESRGQWNTELGHSISTATTLPVECQPRPPPARDVGAARGSAWTPDALVQVLNDPDECARMGHPVIVRGLIASRSRHPEIRAARPRRSLIRGAPLSRVGASASRPGCTMEHRERVDGPLEDASIRTCRRCSGSASNRSLQPIMPWRSTTQAVVVCQCWHGSSRGERLMPMRLTPSLQLSESRLRPRTSCWKACAMGSTGATMFRRRQDGRQFMSS